MEDRFKVKNKGARATSVKDFIYPQTSFILNKGSKSIGRRTLSMSVTGNLFLVTTEKVILS